jgi:hypothetical protein
LKQGATLTTQPHAVNTSFTSFLVSQQVELVGGADGGVFVLRACRPGALSISR